MSAATRVETPSRASRVQVVRSPGGLTAWLVEDYAVPLVALEFSFRGGASQDPVGKAGNASMLAALLDEGAGPLDAEAFQRALEEHAVELHFGADRDGLSGRMRVLTRHAEAAFEALRLALNEARFDAEPIERVRAQMAAGVRRESEDPESLAARAFRQHAFVDHPYGLSLRGSLDSLGRLTRGDLKDMQARVLAKDTLKIAVVGAVDAITVGRWLDDVFGSLPERGDRRPIADVVLGALGERHVVDLAVPQATIRFGRPGIKREDRDYMAGIVVNHILGGGSFSARLFAEVREKRGLAYSIYTSVSSFDHAATLTGGTSTKNERAAETLDIIGEEVARFADCGPSDDELAKAKKYLMGSYALRFDTSTKIAGQLVSLQNDGLGVDYLDERNREIDRVELVDAARVAKRLFGDGKLLVTMVGRPGGG